MVDLPETAASWTSSQRSIGKLNAEINAGLVDPKLRARFKELGGTVLPGSATEFGKLIADDRDRPDGALDHIGVDLDATVVEEACKASTRGLVRRCRAWRRSSAVRPRISASAA
jgi:hypothetical protein